MPEIKSFDLKISFDDKYYLQNLMLAFRDYPREFGKEMIDGLQHVGSSFLKRWRKERLSGPFGVNILSRPQKSLWTHFHKQIFTTSRDGQALSAIDYKLSVSPKHPGTTAVALRQEFGGEVEASANSKWIVPLYARKKMFDQYHKLKFDWDPRFNYGNGRRLFDGSWGLVKIYSKKKKTFFWVQFDRFKNDPHILEDDNILFAEKPSINIPPRLGYYDTFRSHTDRVYQIMNGIIDKTLKRVFKNVG